MLLRFLLVIAVVIAAVLVYAATKPDGFQMQRSIVINAPPEKVFALVNDFRSWPKWAPHDQEDPSIQRNYGAASSGVGAVSEWEGSGSAGKGRAEITRSEANRLVDVDVHFVKPFPAHNLNEFTLTPEGASTRVTWNLDAQNLFVMKVMSVFFTLQNAIGKHLETGLASLKAAAEQ
jgi:uncharacterized protein YndB with AHSA1/START domain